MTRNRIHLWVALGLAILSGAFTYRLYLSADLVNPLYVMLSLCALGSFIASALCVAFVSVTMAQRETASAREVVSAALFQWRFLLAVAIGLIPILALQTSYINVSAQAEIWSFNDCAVYQNPDLCQPLEIPTQNEWIAQSLALLATAIGLSGSVLFSAAAGFFIGKRVKQYSHWVAIGVSILMMVIVLLLAGNSLPLVSFDVPVARIVIITLLPYVLAAALLRQ